MEKKYLAAALVVAAVLVPAVASAQMCNFDLKYDPSSVMTISGKVLATINYNPGNPAMAPKGVLVSSGDEVYNVFLGPGWFADQIDLSLNKGDAVSVTGSMRNIAGESYLVASAVTMEDKVFAFRNAAGMPLWPGMGVPTPPVGRGPGMAALIPFDENRIITVSGRIISVFQQQTPEDVQPSVVVILKPTGAFRHRSTVLLAPMSYLMGNGISLASGSHLWVRGSLTFVDGQRMVCATNVRQATTALNIRTINGAPIWAPAGSVPAIAPPMAP